MPKRAEQQFLDKKLISGRKNEEFSAELKSIKTVAKLGHPKKLLKRSEENIFSFLFLIVEVIEKVVCFVYS